MKKYVVIVVSLVSLCWSGAESSADGQVKIAGNFEIFLKAIVKVERTSEIP